MPKHVDPPRFIQLPQVIEMTTLAKPTIYKYMANGVLYNKKSDCFYLLVLYQKDTFFLFKMEKISVSILLRMKILLLDE